MKRSQTPLKISIEKAKLPHGHLFSKIPTICFIIGIIALLIAFYLGQAHSQHFFYSFHVSWLFYLSIAMGAVFFVIIQFAAKVGWSVVVRRLAENIAVTVPLFLILSIVMFIGMKSLYHQWLSPEAMVEKVIQEKSWYLNIPFFSVRSLFYLVIFSVAGIYYAKNSAKQDETGYYTITYKLQNASFPFLIVLGLCSTFAAFDWIMSLDPFWYSTVFGIYFFAGCYVSFFALLSILTRLTWAKSQSSLSQIVNKEHYHDLGKILFGQSCFWAYAGFCQYFLIWYGNLPEETKWYGIRENHGWGTLFVILVAGHFLVPFFFLMARKAKRSKLMVVLVAFVVLCMHFLDIYWLVMPTLYESGPQFYAMDIFNFVGIGALFIAVFSAVTKRKALIPVEDPRLYESMTFENV